MEILTFELGPAATNAYLLWEKGGDEAVLIDAPHGTWQAVKPELEERGLELKALLVTHGHWDHVADGFPIKQETGAKLYAHTGDREWIEDSTFMNQLLQPELHIKGVKIDHWVEAGDVLEFIGKKFEVRYVPGHSPGSVLFYVEDEGVGFVGDVIFKNSIGRTDLPKADFDTLIGAVRDNVFSLPDETVLYSGHGPKTLVEVEKASNPFFQQ